MKCYSCGGTYNEYKGRLELKNKCIGTYSVDLPEYYKCAECADLLFPKEAASIIEAKENAVRNELISGLPVSEFITATEAAEILEITRQAFHKHRRIKNGFIYSAMIGGKRLYNRKSVQLFKDTKDGRFELPRTVIASLSTGVFEQSRMISRELLQRLIDNTCAVLNYYPTPNRK